MSSLLADIRCASRSMLRRPGISLMSLLVLAIGIGAVTVMYSTLDTVVMQPLPYESPERLIWLWGTSEVNRSNTLSAIDYFDYRQVCDTFESLAAYLTFRPSALLLGEGEPERVPYTLISYNFFTTLRVSPQLGARCRFKPSCSEYGLQAYRRYGFLKATGKTVWRLLRCNPWNKGERFDPP